MSQADLQKSQTPESPEVELESSTYEIIRNRLANHGKELRARLSKLNDARKEVFGAIETKLLATDRVTTEHNCVPRDMVSIGKRFIFGYNVHFGLKTERHLSDVFSIYRFEDHAFHAEPLDLLKDEQFQRDFQEIYRYYKNAVFAKFFVIGPYLYMVFRIGKSTGDIKAFKWVVHDDSLEYVDNRSDHEVKFPPQHEFEWIRTHRDLHVSGTHPHVSIDDRVFVETTGGDLTVKIENNTETGEGIYSEPVEDPDQRLDDAEYHYAIVGSIVLLRVRPYQENQFRHIVYNEKIQQARRVDSIEHACVLLPDDQGLIFSNGYYLQTGEHKTFDSDQQDMLFERRVVAPNGEDYLYVFYNRMSGVYVLLRYNLIEQQVDTPIICHGATFFHGGEVVLFKSQDEPQKHHAVQIWQTPYVGEDFVPPTNTDSYLYKIGNRDIVRGMAECHEVLGLIEKEDTYANLYVDLVKKAGDIQDSYFWINHEDTFQLGEALAEIRSAASSAVDEFDKVVRVRQNTADQSKKVERQTRDIINQIHRKRFDQILDFVSSLADLRSVRGEVISLRDLRYADLELVEQLDGEVADQSERLAKRCVQFLLEPDSLAPYQQHIETAAAGIDKLSKVADAKKVEEEIGQSAGELEMLIEIVSNLKIDDATQRTTIIDNISAIFSKVNTARAALKSKSKELMSVEGVAEFNSQIKLLDQGVVNYLDICETPEKCEEFLTKVMIQIEEMEGRFAEFDEFVVQLSEKRDEIYNAFESRKLTLVEARNKRASALMNAADRILKGIKTRVDNMESIDDINGYFASDLMIEKVRDIISQLHALDDSVKVDDIQSRLKSTKEDAVRQLKDRQELFVGGENVIKLGNHHFSVNVQALDLTTVMREGENYLHLTGTRFFQKLDAPELLETRAVWDQEVVSEDRNVYRGEYLAYLILQQARSSDEYSAESLARMPEDELTNFVQRFMGPLYDGHYVKGVHDHDAAKLLHAICQMQTKIGLLRFDTRSRALARTYWKGFGDTQRKSLMASQLLGFGTVASLFPDTEKQSRYIDQLCQLLTQYVDEHQLFPADIIDDAAEYLFAELVDGERFAISRTAADLFEQFQSHLRQQGYVERFTSSVDAVRECPASHFALLRDWSQAFVSQHAEASDVVYADELAALLFEGRIDIVDVIDAKARQEIKGLVGSHATIQSGKYQLDYNRFLGKLRDFDQRVVPRFQQYVQLKKDLVDHARDDMRLEEFRPRVLTSFVRNKLIDTVYLPLIGDNLAKQIGVVGDEKRTDLMGLLLLVSPPGYGKTTLMEYVANRLGIIFMKINGPAIGHHVTSLDPAEAPNAGAREEVEKLNLSLEMGDNVMIYLDDIQHCNPEFLQKFISLCDAQRKIEGVYNGRSRTYDLRGRKVCVVMAGNPYTESGEKFQIPDMLSNRADVYNLGEIIGDTADVFEMSYLENSLTSNPVLSKLASRSQHDVYSVIKMAQQDNREGIDFEGNYSLEELNELVAVMKKLMRVRDVILKVSRQYIDSAAQSDDYRTEPPFKLQGSYRNMNRIAEKVAAIMNDQELEQLILTSYENDAQTLTSDTEANLLKLRELLSILTDEEQARWNDIKRAFQQNVKLRGVGSDDKVGQVVLQLSSFNDGLDSIRQALDAGVHTLTSSRPQETEHDVELPARIAELAERNDELEERRQQQGSQMLECVGELRDSLDGIGQVLLGGLQKITAQQSVQPDAVRVPKDIDSGAKAADALILLAEELRNLTTGAIPIDPDQPTQRVSVMHKVPRSILDVLRGQFELMNNWMQPLLEATREQATGIEQLRNSLDQCMTKYETLIGDLEKANTRSP